MKFFNLSNLPTVQSSPTGEKIYKWSYLDKTGKLKQGEKNLYEEIQSCKNQTDYKSRLKQGETFEDNGTGIYLDTTKFSGGLADVNEYLANISNSIREELGKNIDIRTETESIKQDTPPSGEIEKQGNGDIEQGGNK